MCTPNPIRSGCKRGYNDESWTNWWLFNVILTQDEIDDFCEEENIDTYYSGPGCVFTSGPHVQKSLSYTLITCDGAYDI